MVLEISGIVEGHIFHLHFHWGGDKIVVIWISSIPWIFSWERHFFNGKSTEADDGGFNLVDDIRHSAAKRRKMQAGTTD